MSTTEQPATPVSPGRGPTPERLASYLDRRERLAARWAEEMSHGLPGGETLRELMLVEQALAHCWPDVYEANWREWSVSDSALLHSVDGRPDPACSICQPPTGRGGAVP